ncbi:unnamed protein product, partial [marine sediment metagenome]
MATPGLALRNAAIAHIQNRAGSLWEALDESQP